MFFWGFGGGELSEMGKWHTKIDGVDGAKH